MTRTQGNPVFWMEFFLYIIAPIKKGTPRDPFFDVVSDIKPGIFE